MNWLQGLPTHSKRGGSGWVDCADWRAVPCDPEGGNCSNGESLASTEAQASDKNHVLDALGKVASEIRSKLGESLASVQKYDAPAENVTTASLEALKAYSLGYQAMIVKSDPPPPSRCSSGRSA